MTKNGYANNDSTSLALLGVRMSKGGEEIAHSQRQCERVIGQASPSVSIRWGELGVVA